jgi:PAS domain S-box-containing protein
LLESVGQSVIATNAVGKITYWNKVAEQIYGWSAEEAVGENVAKLNMTAQGGKKSKGAHGMRSRRRRLERRSRGAV